MPPQAEQSETPGALETFQLGPQVQHADLGQYPTRTNCEKTRGVGGLAVTTHRQAGPGREIHSKGSITGLLRGRNEDWKKEGTIHSFQSQGGQQVCPCWFW